MDSKKRVLSLIYLGLANAIRQSEKLQDYAFFYINEIQDYESLLKLNS